MQYIADSRKNDYWLQYFVVEKQIRYLRSKMQCPLFSALFIYQKFLSLAKNSQLDYIELIQN